MVRNQLKLARKRLPSGATRILNDLSQIMEQLRTIIVVTNLK